MRPDVKLGVVLSMAVVLVAGGYFIYRGSNEAPVPVVDDTDALTGRVAQKPSETTTAQPPATRADRERRTSPKPNAAGRPAQAQGTRPPGSGAVAAAKRGNSTTSEQRGSGNTQRQSGASPVGQPRSGQEGSARMATGTQQPGHDAENRPGGDRETQPAPSESTNTPQNDPGTAPTGSRVADASHRQSGAALGEADSTAPHRAAPSTGPITLTGTRPPTTGSGTQPGTAERPTSPDANAAVDTHLVQMGDTLSSLARRYYGSERYTQFLIDSNPHLADPNRLAIGSRVNIPPMPPDGPAGASGTAARSSSTTTQPAGSTTAGRGSTPTATEQGRTYRVQSGDSFYSIARDVLHDHSRWSELFELNKELVKGDARNLQIGQVIKLPPG